MSNIMMADLLLGTQSTYFFLVIPKPSVMSGQDSTLHFVYYPVQIVIACMWLRFITHLCGHGKNKIMGR